MRARGGVKSRGTHGALEARTCGEREGLRGEGSSDHILHGAAAYHSERFSHLWRRETMAGEG